jgi:N-acyl amino acid synthase of PEP-CTERM/exosortase system
VYCIENGYEDPDKPDHLETDEFDSHAAHGLLHCRRSSDALGTVRLILPLDHDPHDSFAVQRVLHSDVRSAFNKLPLHAMGEVSRFSISRHIRRRADSTDLTGQIAASGNSGPLMRLGLIQALIRMCIENGITHWCAAMEPTLLRMLAAMAIRFKPVGPLVDYHGRRQPCYCVVADVLNAVKRERPAFWSVLTNGGALAY